MPSSRRVICQNSLRRSDTRTLFAVFPAVDPYPALMLLCLPLLLSGCISAQCFRRESAIRVARS